MARKNVTISLEESVYEKYQEYCKKNAIALSRSIELFMEKKLKEEKK
jgi:phage/plasmid-associated DNA primase